MKFDYCIGNPPYQVEAENCSSSNGQAPRKNVFHYMQQAADEITKGSSCLIYPAVRWIHQSGKGMQQFGHDQMNDKRMSKLVVYKNAKDVFSQDVDIGDGVSIVIKSQNKSTDGFDYEYHEDGKVYTVHADNPQDDIMPLNPNDTIISRKIQVFVNKYNLGYIHDSVLPRSLFAIESDFVEKNPDKVRKYSNGMKLSDKSIKILTNDKAGKAGRAMWFVTDKSNITSHKELIDEYQVVVSSANAGGQKRDNQLEIIPNKAAFGRSRVALKSFKSEKEAQVFFKYMKSYIIRFAFLLTDENLTSLGKYVPDILNYDKSEIFDFSLDFDVQLCKILELTDDEFAYIKKRVDDIRTQKEMN